MEPVNSSNEISVYKDAFSEKVAIEQIARVRRAFPKLTAEFLELLFSVVKEEKIPASRLKDSVDNLIKSYEYPVPTIANILKFDKKIKLFTYYEVCEMNHNSGRAFSDLAKVKKNGNVYWISKADKEKYNVQDEI